MFVIPWFWGWNFVTRCVLVQSKIMGQSHQILFERLPPQIQDLHGFFRPLNSTLLNAFLAGTIGFGGKLDVARKHAVSTYTYRKVSRNEHFVAGFVVESGWTQFS